MWLCSIALISCSGFNAKFSPFLEIYKNNGVAGNILPEYIILKSHPRTFEMFSPTVNLSIYGKWERNKDTLLLFPLYEMVNYDINNISVYDSTELSIVHKFLIEKNQIVDITDYSPITTSSELIDYNNYHPIYYKRTIK